MGTPWHIDDAHEIGISNGNLLFWTSMIHQVIRPHTGKEIVLDYGCGDGQFLRLMYQMRPMAFGLGVDTDQEAIERARVAVREGEPLRYAIPNALDGMKEHFDLVFSQEIFWMVEDLATLARTLFRVTKERGEYYATFGCHTGNPLWPHRRRLLQEEGFSTFDYSLDQVADIFDAAGFEVGLKRLPLEYFLIYEPEFTRRRAQSLSKLVETTHDHKMLFCFRRDTEWRQRNRVPAAP
jgi:SAM-dependent methyltransferase